MKQTKCLNEQIEHEIKKMWIPDEQIQSNTFKDNIKSIIGKNKNKKCSQFTQEQVTLKSVWVLYLCKDSFP